MVTNGILRWAATRMASRRSSLQPQLLGSHSGYQVLINAPTTSTPALFSKAVETALSTPPDKPPKTFLLRGVFDCLCLFQILAIFVSFIGPKVAPTLEVPGMSVLSISRS